MILVDKNFVHLQTKNNSYLMHINKYGDIENLHYGAKIISNNLSAFVGERSFIVNTLFAKEDMTHYEKDNRRQIHSERH